MIRVALSHDIDRVDKTHQYFTKSLKHLNNFNWKGVSDQFKSMFINKPYWTFDEFIKIEESFGIRSTVFFLNETIKFNPFSLNSFKLSMGRYNILSPEIIEVIRFLDSNGWEIGVHGSFNSYKNEELLKKEKLTLEQITGHPISGVRQHYLNLDENTWQIQHQIGFKYDSSWGFTRDIGFKDGRVTPFYPLNNQFKVIPLTLMDTCFMSQTDKWAKYDKLLDECEEKGAVMVINFHQHVFCKYDFPGYRETYIDIINRALNRGAQFFTLSQI